MVTRVTEPIFDDEGNRIGTSTFDAAGRFFMETDTGNFLRTPLVPRETPFSGFTSPLMLIIVGVAGTALFKLFK